MELYSPARTAATVSDNSLRPVTGVVPEGLVSLGIGEPDFPTPTSIVDAMCSALQAGYTNYGDFNGDPELRELIAHRTTQQTGAAISSNDVLITHGGSSAITATLMATVNPGDQVVIPEPTYSLYADIVRLIGAIPVFVPLTPQHQLDVEKVATAAKSARLLVLCNPGNPTGVILRKESLERLGRALEGTGCLVLADEAYADFDYNSTFVPCLAVPEIRERIVLCQTLSKTYSMTGWRVGYVIAPPGISGWIRQVHRGMNGSINAAVQRAAIVALTLGPSQVAEQIREYRKRKDYVLDRLRRIPGLRWVDPEGAFYVLVYYSDPVSSLDMVQRLRDHGVLVRAGNEYGPSGEGSIRLSFAAGQEILEVGMDRFAAALK
ncbi:aminotransferase class I/II-fold pyridoxal phosphate-dependent enzyme [Pseudarthrobacter sp. AG30]|nr:aminotransferase class I/II-fold pyridoxal phosphate-dependent enzyme [Pseudarthrobacter sp. AG30]